MESEQSLISKLEQPGLRSIESGQPSLRSMKSEPPSLISIEEVIKDGSIDDILKQLELHSSAKEISLDEFVKVAEKVIEVGKSQHIMKMLQIDSYPISRLAAHQFAEAAKKVITYGTPNDIIELLQRDSHYASSQLVLGQFAGAADKVLENGSTDDILKLLKLFSSQKIIDNQLFAMAAKKVIESGTPHDIMKLLKRDSYYESSQLAPGQFAIAADEVIKKGNLRDILELLKGCSSQLSADQRAIAVRKVIENDDDYLIVELLKKRSGEEEEEACKANGSPFFRKWWFKPCILDLVQRREATAKVIENGNPGAILKLLEEYSALSSTQIAGAVHKLIKQKKIGPILQLLKGHFFHLDPKPTITKAVNKVLVPGKDHPDVIVDLLESCPELDPKQIAKAVGIVVKRGNSGDVLDLLAVPWLKEYPHLNHQQIAKGIVEKVIKEGEPWAAEKLSREHIGWLDLYLNPLQKDRIFQKLRALQEGSTSTAKA
jgi:hypothetical protein